MPRYLIERTFHVGEDAMPDVGRRSRRIAEEQFPGIIWQHSHVVADEEGNLKSFCVYAAPDVDTVRRHADLLGDHTVERIFEIGGDVTPDDFPL